MKQTQLYLDEEMGRILETLSRQKGMTISELVRTSLREHYMRTEDLDRVSLARDLTGIWKNRKDLKDMDAAVRKLRKGSRLKRCRIG
jgi:predicted DNA-binding protein